MFTAILRSMKTTALAVVFAVASFVTPAIATFDAVMSAPVAMRPQGQRGAAAATFVIGIAVAILVTALIIPIAFDSFFGADTGSWDAQTILIWGIIPVVGLLAVVLYFLNKASDQA